MFGWAFNRAAIAVGRLVVGTALVIGAYRLLTTLHTRALRAYTEWTARRA